MLALGFIPTSPSGISSTYTRVVGLRCYGHRRWGVTFLEVVVVLAIISVLAAIALPRYANAMAQQRADSAARRVVLDLAFAQRQARMSSSNQLVVFSVAGSSYSLTDVADLDHTASTYTVELSRPPYEAILVSADFDGDLEIIFDGYGIPDSGGSVVLHVGGVFKTITVSSETGTVSVQ